MVEDEVLKKAEETLRKKDSIQYVVTEEVVEAISSDNISEVDMDREMRLSQRIVDELLSIYIRPVHKNLFLEFPKYPGRFMLHFDI